MNKDEMKEIIKEARDKDRGNCRRCGKRMTKLQSFKLNDLWYCHSCFRDKTDDNGHDKR